MVVGVGLGVGLGSGVVLASGVGVLVGVGVGAGVVLAAVDGLGVGVADAEAAADAEGLDDAGDELCVKTAAAKVTAPCCMLRVNVVTVAAGRVAHVLAAAGLTRASRYA